VTNALLALRGKVAVLGIVGIAVIVPAGRHDAIAVVGLIVAMCALVFGALVLRRVLIVLRVARVVRKAARATCGR
jgi:hypothetical protein